MALPIQNTPVHTLVVPSSKETLKYRPFLVKEQKALLLAQQSEDPVVMIDTLKDMIRSCAKTPINVDKLAVFDLEYIFSQIRAKSAGEFVDLFFFCDEDHGEDNEKAKALVRIDLTQLQVEFSPGHESKIHLFDNVGVVMKYPTIEVVKKIEQIGNEREADMVFDIICECMDYIYDGDEIYYSKEQSREELKDFIENLTQDQFQKIEKFFETMPKLKHNVSYKCPVCGKQHEKTLEGLNNFF